MVLREVDETTPSTSSDSQSPPTSPPIVDATDPSLTTTIPNWTPAQIKALFLDNPTYPNPFTPLPIYSRLLGRSEAARDQIITSNVNRTQLCIDRPLTPVEVQAEAHYQSIFHEAFEKSEFIGVTSFFILAYVRQRAGRPGVITPYAKKLLGDRIGEWYIRSSRFVVYAAMGSIQGRIIGALIGMNRMTEMMNADPNVQELRRDLAEFKKWGEEELRRRMQLRRAGVKGGPLVPTPEEIRLRHHPHEQAPGLGQGQQGSSAASGDLIESEIETPADYEPPPAATTQSIFSTRAPPPSTSTSTTDTSRDDPLSPFLSEQDDRTTSRSTSRIFRGAANPGESSWDRIRRQQFSGGAADSSSEQSSSSSSYWNSARQTRSDNPPVPKTESFTFSATEEERQLAKAQAQKDFDAILERERRGAADDAGFFGRRGSDRE